MNKGLDVMDSVAAVAVCIIPSGKALRLALSVVGTYWNSLDLRKLVSCSDGFGTTKAVEQQKLRQKGNR